jgi:uncharacterized lipoprotein YmbA
MSMKAQWMSLTMMLTLMACTPPALDNLSNIGKESDPTRFYTLTANAEADKKQPSIPDVIVGVGPVSVADYLDRSHIVVRKSETQLELEEFDRWAGSPAKEIQRVLGANLATLLGTERITGYPWKSGIAPDITVEAAVERFEYDAAGKVWLVASWQVFDENGRRVVAFHRSMLNKESKADYNSISAALSDLTAELAQAVATSVRAAYR